MAKKKENTPAPALIVTDLGNGYSRIVAENGLLYSIALMRVIPVAVVKPENIKNFKAIANG